jgi:hypothetical protein
MEGHGGWLRSDHPTARRQDVSHAADVVKGVKTVHDRYPPAEKFTPQRIEDLLGRVLLMLGVIADLLEPANPIPPPGEENR